MSSPRVSPALELIRASTRAAHRALESQLEVARPDAGDAAYTRYLSALLGWLEPLERALWSEAWPAQVFAAMRSDKSHWIESDLRARGFCDRALSALPRQRALPPLESAAERFGVAYVVEGAQLGGQHLLRSLGPRLAPLPARWLEGYGGHTGEQWRSFMSALGAALRDPQDAKRAADSARATFELAHAWFAARGVA